MSGVSATTTPVAADEVERVRGELPLLPGVKASATMSPCGSYRYGLHRDWWPKKGKGHVLWIMLNPSAASAQVDDRTIRKCQKFARAWGYDGITVCNLFGLRATSPDDLRAHDDPVGEANDDVLRCFMGGFGVGLAVAAWGVHGALAGRSRAVIGLAAQERRKLSVLDLTKNGHPRHPLYVPDATLPVRWFDPYDPEGGS